MNPAWQEELKKALAAAERVAVLGIGSPLLSDDAAGLALIEALQERGLASERLLLIGGSSAPENFTGVICAFVPDLLLVVDAARLGVRPGSLALLPPELQEGAGFATHMLPFSVMLRYLAQSGVENALMLGLEPQNLEFGLELSAPVRRAVIELADFLSKNLKGQP